MVLIEPVETVNGTTTSPAAAATAAASAAGDTAGYASDGFETASEADLNQDDDAVVGEGGEEREQSTEDGVAGAAKGAEEERPVELTQGEINEKLLAEANSSKVEGNNLFKDGRHEEALLKYDNALQAVQSISTSTEICSVCHANRAACYSKLEKYEDTIKECTKALDLNPKYIKVLIRRAEAHEKLEHFEDAIADMTKVLEIEPSNDQARRNIVRLKPLADEKREKMKEEMIGKLKEMGNSVLGRFGMSIDNFKAVKDPNTGSYSISFQR